MIYRETAGDFRVEEIPFTKPSGNGRFWYLQVEKVGLDSAEVVSALATSANCSPQDVGMAGRKDRHAITRQWFSVPVGSAAQAPDLSLVGASVIEVSKHDCRLRLGDLKANRFKLVVRDVDATDRANIQENVSHVQQEGFANRFGRQRFGRYGNNAEQGRDILLGRKKVKNRRLARFLVSALQSEVFNVSLELRCEEIGFEKLVDGDLILVHATGSLFWIDSAEQEQQRMKEHVISATGPLMGDKMRKPFAAAGRWENAALEKCDLTEGLFRSRKSLRLSGARRSIRAFATDLSVEFSDDTAEFSLCLPPGSYASVFLEEICGAKLKEVRS